eukprot:TRINITY_DN5023_c0_g1_i3.p1 TRINITY_DN5023_c0_g1~~TRINITY_DN5023_c0_g1_i3.p1  ORF type:complete len:1162 (-),score=319.38 TRINITY_DN5023_c0_g1_i3:270-3662(-)
MMVPTSVPMNSDDSESSDEDGSAGSGDDLVNVVRPPKRLFSRRGQCSGRTVCVGIVAVLFGVGSAFALFRAVAGSGEYRGCFSPEAEANGSWIRECARCADRERGIAEVQKFEGRIGNNVAQIQHHLVCAACLGPPSWTVEMPPGGPLRDIFPNLPLVLQAGSSAGWRPEQCGYEQCGKLWSCAFEWPGNRGVSHTCKSTLKDRIGMMAAYFTPFARPGLLRCASNAGTNASAAPVEDESSTEPELTIHVRTGDVAYDTAYVYAQPPCAWYRYVIDHGNDGAPFQRVRVVAADTTHLCIDDLRARYGARLTVQSSEVASDFGTIACAENLLLSHSTFANYALLMNPSVRRLFLYSAAGARRRDWNACEDALVAGTTQAPLDEYCAAFPRAAVVEGSFPGAFPQATLAQGLADVAQANRSYFLAYPEASIELRRCPGAAAAAPAPAAQAPAPKAAAARRSQASAASEDSDSDAGAGNATRLSLTPSGLSAALAARLGEAQKLVNDEVFRLEERVEALADENEQHKEDIKHLRAELKTMKREKRTLTKQVKREKERADAHARAGARGNAPASASSGSDADSDGEKESAASGSDTEVTKTAKAEAPLSPTSSAVSPLSGRAARERRLGGRTRARVSTGPIFASAVVGTLMRKLNAAVFTATKEKTAYEKLQKRLDKDANGRLECNEWLQALRKDFKISPTDVTDAQATQVFEELDAKASGDIDVDDLLLLVDVSSKRKALAKDASAITSTLLWDFSTRLWRASHRKDGTQLDEAFFQRVDKDGQGSIDLDEWRTMLRMELKMITITDAQAAKIFERVVPEDSEEVPVGDLRTLCRGLLPGDLKAAPFRILKEQPGLSQSAIGRVVAKLKAAVFSSDGASVNHDFFDRLEAANPSGKLDVQAWTQVVRNECKLGPSGFSKENIQTSFSVFDVHSSGSIDADALFDVARTIYPFENARLSAFQAEIRRVHNVCRILSWGKKKLKYETGGKCVLTDFQKESRVRVTGLIARKDINGAEGFVMDFFQKEWKYIVKLDDGQILRFAPVNLVSAEAEIDEQQNAANASDNEKAAEAKDTKAREAGKEAKPDEVKKDAVKKDEKGEDKEEEDDDDDDEDEDEEEDGEEEDGGKEEKEEKE